MWMEMGSGLMNKNTENECKQMIEKYYSFKQEKRKIKIRNELYCIMSGDIQMWIKSILRKWGRYEEEGEILSISFDAFLFCLEQYNIKKTSGLNKFFYDAIRYFLLMKYGKENKVRLPVKELKEILEMDSSPEGIVFDNLLTLIQFRDCLPNDITRVVWDDAAMSLSSENKYKVRSKKDGTKYSTGMDNLVYKRLKEAFINQIKLILNIKNKL